MEHASKFGIGSFVKKGERFSEICTSPSAWLAQLYGLVRRCVFMISYKLEDLVELGFTTQYTAQSCILCKRVPAIKSLSSFLEAPVVVVGGEEQSRITWQESRSCCMGCRQRNPGHRSSRSHMQLGFATSKQMRGAAPVLLRSQTY